MSVIEHCKLYRILSMHDNIFTQLLMSNYKISRAIIVCVFINETSCHIYLNSGSVFKNIISLSNLVQENTRQLQLMNNIFIIDDVFNNKYISILDKYMHQQTNIIDIPFEIILMIFDELEFYSQLQFKKTCRRFASCDVTNAWNIDKFEIFKQISHRHLAIDVLKKYAMIRNLRLPSHIQINSSDLSIFTKLEKLDISQVFIGEYLELFNLKRLRKIYLNKYQYWRMSYLDTVKYIEINTYPIPKFNRGASNGYIQRKLIQFMESIIIGPDGHIYTTHT